MNRSLEVFVRFLRLGLTSFGGPMAHLAYFRREFVDTAKWVDDAGFKEMVALCSVLPGPTSSQVGMMLGSRRAGPLGGLLAWLGFTAPTAIVLATIGIAIRSAQSSATGFAQSAGFGGILEGFAAAAAAVVLTAVVQMARGLLRTWGEAAIAVIAFGLTLAAERYAPSFTWFGLVAGGALGAVLIRSAPALPKRSPKLDVTHNVAFACGGAFVVLLVGLPIVATPGTYLDLFAEFFRAGSLVFGGGHVVLPFLANFVGTTVPERTFFAGYGLTQAMPGPLFAFSAFLGGAAQPLGGVAAALVALAGIYLPSFLLLAAVMPLWSALRDLPRANSVLAGLNASVVGLLGAVFVNPIALSLRHDPVAIVLAIASFALLTWTRLPAWAPAIGCATIAFALRAGSLVR